MMEDRLITDDLSDIDSQELMKSLPDYFVFTGDINHTAYLNWRFALSEGTEQQFFMMGEGYFETSIALIEQCIADNRSKRADIWIFPILFNIVHGTEIYLKGFNSIYPIYHELEESGELLETKIEGKHDIKQLCHLAIKRLQQNGDNELLGEMQFVEKFIDILYNNTQDMTFARYPITAKKEQHFYIGTPGNVTIDLIVLRQWVLRLFRILSDVTGFVQYTTEQMKEMLADNAMY